MPAKKSAFLAWALCAVIGLTGCAQIPKAPDIKLSDYRHVAVVQSQSPSNFVVEYRYPPGSAPGMYAVTATSTSRTGSFIGALAVGLLQAGMESYWSNQRDDFNKVAAALHPDVARQLQSSFAQQLGERLKQQTPGLQVQQLTLQLHYPRAEPVGEHHLRLMQQVRQQCPQCDMALVVDPAFGYYKNMITGYRLYGNSQLLAFDIQRALNNAPAALAYVPGSSAPSTAIAPGSTAVRYAAPQGRQMQAQFFDRKDNSYKYLAFTDLKDDASVAVLRLPKLTQPLADQAIEALLKN